MKIKLYKDSKELGRQAAAYGAARLRTILKERGSARIILATGASQFELLEALCTEKNLDWSRVTAFHLDEYIGLPENHGASFRVYLKERFQNRVSVGQFHFI